MAVSLDMRADELRSLAFGSIGASYTAIGSEFDHPMRIIKIQNLTDANLIFSFDGVLDHLILPPNGFDLYDVSANKIVDGGFYVSANTQIYVKQSGVPASGAVYVSAFFARGT